jgi:glycosyltransferase involved in cell wall biosynthesis
MPNMPKEITVVIPSRVNEDCGLTLNSLAEQSYKGFDIEIIYDGMGKGANWARNQGFKNVKTEFVLFSDNDIQWKTHALETLLRVLKAHPKASFSYGRYKKGSGIFCHRAWDPKFLTTVENYISTMSLIRVADLPDPPFDESIKRLQDYDLWLNMWLNYGRRGVYVEDLIFETPNKQGITNASFDNYDEATKVLNKKYALNLPLTTQ